MITIDFGKKEYYDSEANEFVYIPGGTVRFEYSLKAVYDWECRWRKPFLKAISQEGLTNEELIDFYLCMALDPINKDFITNSVANKLKNYIDDSQTATTFSSVQDGQNGNNINKAKTHTAEELYALMFMAGIPIEFEYRNLNRLLVTLRIMSSYNTTPKKMSKTDIYRQNAELNRQRKAKYNTKG